MTDTKPIYLDYNATTPIAEEVAETMAPFLYGHFGNPSSRHSYGTTAKKAVEQARDQVAQILNCQKHEVIFTSGGTESNNMAIRGAAYANQGKGSRIITTAIEHPAVTNVCRHLETRGFKVTYLPVNQYGWVNPKTLKAALTPDTILVSIMHANNEVGTIEPIRECADLAHQAGALFHTDAAQTLGKWPVDVQDLHVDLLSIAGHKVYAPKGVGALYLREGVELVKIMFGANHESDRRPGTENVLEIVGLGKACEIAQRDLEHNISHFKTMRDRLHDGIKSALPENAFLLNGHPEKRLPNTLSLGFCQIEANALLDEIKDRVAASAGAACHSGNITLSNVLEAMNVPVEYAMGTIRLSVGRGTTAEMIDKAVEVLAQSLQKTLP